MRREAGLVCGLVVLVLGLGACGGGSGGQSAQQANPNGAAGANPEIDENPDYTRIKLYTDDDATRVELDASADGMTIHWTDDRACVVAKNGCAESVRYLHEQRPLQLPAMSKISSYFPKHYYWLTDSTGRASSTVANGPDTRQLSGFAVGTGIVQQLVPAFGKLWAVCVDEGCESTEMESGDLMPGVERYHSVWTSTDGATWVEEFTTPFGPDEVYMPRLIKYADQLLVIADDSTWISDDGQNWQQWFDLDYLMDYYVTHESALWSFEKVIVEGGRPYRYSLIVRRLNSEGEWEKRGEVTPVLTENLSIHVQEGELVVLSGQNDFTEEYTVHRSTDGANWSVENGAFPVDNMRDVAVVADVFHALGQDSQYLSYPNLVNHYSSADGITWQLQRSQARVDLGATLIEFDGELWAFGGESGSTESRKFVADVARYSETENSWLLINQSREHIESVTGQARLGDLRYQRDTNGAIWWKSDGGLLWQRWQHAPYVEGYATLFAHQSKIWVGHSNNLYSSADGLKWTVQSDLDVSFDNTPAAFSYDDRIWVDSIQNSYLTSEDAITWHTVTPSRSILEYSVEVCNGSMYALDLDGYLLSSTDGFQWNTVADQTLPSGSLECATTDEMWLIADSTDEDRVSNDNGVTWTVKVHPSRADENASYGRLLFE